MSGCEYGREEGGERGKERRANQMKSTITLLMKEPFVVLSLIVICKQLIAQQVKAPLPPHSHSYPATHSLSLVPSRGLSMRL